MNILGLISQLIGIKTLRLTISIESIYVVGFVSWLQITCNEVEVKVKKKLRVKIFDKGIVLIFDE